MTHEAFQNKNPHRPGTYLPPTGTMREHSATSFSLQAVIDASGSHIAILDEDRTILYVNRAWRQFATRTGSLIGQFGIGCKYPDICMGTAAASAPDASALAAGIDRVIAKKEVAFEMEYKCTATIEPVWFRLRAQTFLLRDLGGTSVVLVSHDDITSEKQARKQLLEDRESLARLWGTTNILPWEADAETWAFTLVGERAEQLLGYPGEMWFEPDFWASHIHPHDKDTAIAKCAKLSQTENQYQFEYRMIASDGRIVWINDIVSVHRQNGRPVRLSGFMVDVSDRKRADDTLRLLGGRLIAAQEEERKRIARELHDDLNQRMALLSIELEQVGQMLAAKTEGTAERVRGLQKKALDISTEIHRMSYMLHPSKLDHLGLVPALKSYFSELAENRGLSVDFRHKGFPEHLPADITLCIFRIAQEGLQNAAKYSGGSDVSVVLSKSDSNVELTISDNGCGFDMNSDKMSKGLGFISMRERLRLVDGDMRIRSRPSRGTQISISIPMDSRTKTGIIRPVLLSHG